MSTARETALQVLERCRRDGAWSGQSLDQLLRAAALDERDAALAAQLSLSVLQNRRYLDYYIDLYCSAPRLEPKLRDLLRLGACQLLLLDRIPAHAAVDETVALCKKLGLGRASGLVNAVLRRLSEHRESLPEIPGRGTSGYLALRYSQEDWLAEELIAQRGYDFAEAFFAACQTPALTDLQINPLKTTREAFLALLDAQGVEYSVPPFPESCVSLRGGRVDRLPGYDEGLFYVQDRAAAMAVEIAGVQPGMCVLDLCAAPGGKSFAAALRMLDRGEILSCDLHEKKLRLVESGAKRLGIGCIRALAADARQPDPAWRGIFDLVIADKAQAGIPCRQHGPVRQLNDHPGPVAEAAAICRVVVVLRSGRGDLDQAPVIGTDPKMIIGIHHQTHPAFSSCEFTVDGHASEGGCYTFWPQIDGSDGFFAAKLRRRQA